MRVRRLDRAEGAIPLSASFIQTPVEPALLGGFWVFCKRNDLSPSVGLRLAVHHAITRAGYLVDDYDPGSERRGDFNIWQRRRR